MVYEYIRLSDPKVARSLSPVGMTSRCLSKSVFALILRILDIPLNINAGIGFFTVNLIIVDFNILRQNIVYK
jgi:hypothetical protein